MNPLAIIELTLKIADKILDVILEAMKGQTPEQKAILWQRHIDSLQFWDKVLKLDDLRAFVLKENAKTKPPNA